MNPFSSSRRSLCGLLLLSSCIAGCSVAEPKISANVDSKTVASKSDSVNSTSANPQGATIPIDPNGPADTVRVFYKHLREQKFREAIFLTNLKPAIASLNDIELKDFSLDFEAIAGQIPAEVKINGEIVTGDQATVTFDLPNEEDGKIETQTMRLRKEGEVWVILIVDEASEGDIKKEGKNYFYSLRIKTHEEEAKKMLERISKAELVHGLQNGGVFADMDTLVSSGLLPEDIKTSASTGYNYTINLAADKRKYTATATPAEYGKSGKISYLLQLDAKNVSHVKSKDTGGKPMTK
ncbi:MAG: hypothetical protein IPL32_05315 [Chloracidobacterium sp.]|nr:hypothetical protein [Chloracidobacterium sp.]